MTYEDAVQFLSSRRAKGMKLGLEHIRELLRRLDHPERRFKSIHIAGTNGKGSTAAMLESILRRAGYRTGLYTSPHLVDLRERIKVDGEAISPEDFLYAVADIQTAAVESDASFFEILTALAFKYFADQRVDIAVVETGLGGRLDATNLLIPEITVITEIGLDHTDILGDRIEAIAREKAGILKPGVPAIIGGRDPSLRPLFIQEAERRGVTLRFAPDEVRIEQVTLSESGTVFDAWIDQRRYPKIRLSLLGGHQVENATTVLSVVETLRSQGWAISDRAVYEGFAKTVWRARLELIQIAPKIVLDSAHNPSGAKRLAGAIEEIFLFDKLILVFGVLADKDYRAMAEILFPLADRIILTKPQSDRALSPEELAEKAQATAKHVAIHESIDAAWTLALKEARHRDLILATGSIYFVGEVLRLMGLDALRS